MIKVYQECCQMELIAAKPNFQVAYSVAYISLYFKDLVSAVSFVQYLSWWVFPVWSTLKTNKKPLPCYHQKPSSPSCVYRFLKLSKCRGAPCRHLALPSPESLAAKCGSVGGVTQKRAAISWAEWTTTGNRLVCLPGKLQLTTHCIRSLLAVCKTNQPRDKHRHTQSYS